DKELPDGMLAKEIKPYIMDLGSTNGTFINGNRIEAERYYELMEQDTVKFGNSSFFVQRRQGLMTIYSCYSQPRICTPAREFCFMMGDKEILEKKEGSF
ncbi:FHA domain-containing protein DDL, partial [Tanacetum coccineum]